LIRKEEMGGGEKREKSHRYRPAYGLSRVGEKNGGGGGGEVAWPRIFSALDRNPARLLGEKLAAKHPGRRSKKKRRKKEKGKKTVKPAYLILNEWRPRQKEKGEEGRGREEKRHDFWWPPAADEKGKKGREGRAEIRQTAGPHLFPSSPKKNAQKKGGGEKKK